MMRRRSLLAAAVAGGALALPGCERAPGIAGDFTGTSPGRGHLLREPPRGMAPGVTRRVHTLIAGGGVAGLAAARALRLQGRDDFALLELEDTAGGNSRAGSLRGMACPLGAHYLPVPGDDAHEVQDLLEELSLRQRVAGRWQYDERHLCHSPQERLFFNGEWQDGLLPVQGVGAATLAQYTRFAQRIAQLQRTARFALPSYQAPFTSQHAALDGMTFARWLDEEGLDDAHLRWYLDYCCRDDYGAGIATVSAWAGVHYFASRHGFQAPGGDDTPRDAVLTWPEGNGWLTRQLAAPLGDRLRPARTVLRIAETRQGVEVDAWDHATRTLERWQARLCIVALPVFVAARIVQDPPAVLRAAAARARYAPWLVANIHLRAPLHDRPGAPPSWDNVLYGSAGLGYVDARHQLLDPRPGPTVLTWYHAPGPSPQARAQLLDAPWSHWRAHVLAELAHAHPDLPDVATQIDITRYGHAMAVPLPGARHAAAAAAVVSPPGGVLRFAHSDWSGYSVFEEAFTRGHHAGMARSGA
jgi:monoamine oxidase